ncbi:MAG: peptidoglycan-binding protein [Candidatus Epulonipiscioides saccharophilum]|nr:MAG: peptidoglycan-binding protein [Epulopiscium sp. AS2M-Bin001]
MYMHSINNETNTTVGGSLVIQAKTNTDTGSMIPVKGVQVKIFNETGNKEIAQYDTDSVGATPLVTLDAPPEKYSEEEDYNKQPYSLYDVEITSPDFLPVEVKGVQIFSGIKSILPVDLIPTNQMTRESQMTRRSINLIQNNQMTRGPEDVISIGPSTLFGDYPPKIPESEIKEMTATGFVVLSEVMIPEYIIVHAGSPNNNSAPNYNVPYKDYLKNVASSEIYPTWPRETIKANVIAIVSYTLNRVYTEWYRNKGKNYTITNSTAYDHAFTYGRNIFDTVSEVVDDYFDTYVRRPGVTQPLLTQYCDGKKVSCPGWMTQWGSEKLGRDGLSAEEILKSFYKNIEFKEAKQVSGNPESYPGYPLKQGANSPPVRVIQQQLNRISNSYPLIPKVPSNGVFGSDTAKSIKVFQQIFNLTPDGIVGKGTWYKLSEIYVAVTKIAALL